MTVWSVQGLLGDQNEKSMAIRPSVTVNISGRRFPASTEMMIHVEPDIPGFYIALGCYIQNEKPIGYMHFKNTGQREKRADGTMSSNYVLTELFCPSSTAPGSILLQDHVLPDKVC